MNEKGFTLVELKVILLALIVVLGIIAGAILIWAIDAHGITENANLKETHYEYQDANRRFYIN